MRNNVKIQICTSDLSKKTIAEMWSIYAPFYRYSEVDFRARFDRNSHYALYRQSGRLVGFTGLKIEKITVREKKFLTIYFGQTVVMNHVRGKGLINRTGLLLSLKFFRSFLTRKVVCWADALTYRAYLVFAKNLVECYPNRANSLPEPMKALRDHLGYVNYGDRYCPQSGTVAKDVFLVNDPQALISAEKYRDPDIALFAQTNPNYLQGQGLLTMGPLTWENLKYMVKKAFAKRKRQPTRGVAPKSGELVAQTVKVR